MMQKVVFIDKDGTLIVDIPYNADASLIELSDNCIDGLRLLQRVGYQLVIISNQAGVARGLFPESALQGVHEKIQELLQPYNIRLAGFYYCPHHPEGIIERYRMECDCRKPMDGLLRRAARDLAIDLTASWMIGDILNDVEAGNRAGCRSILIDNAHETEWHWAIGRLPFAIVKSIDEAAHIITKSDNA